MHSLDSQIVNLSPNINLYCDQIIKFIHEVFPIKYPESWIRNVLTNGSNSNGNYCFGVVEQTNQSLKKDGDGIDKKGEEKEIRNLEKPILIKSLLVARVLEPDSKEISIPDLYEKILDKRICYIIMIGTKKAYRRNHYAMKLFNHLKFYLQSVNAGDVGLLGVSSLQSHQQLRSSWRISVSDDYSLFSVIKNSPVALSRLQIGESNFLEPASQSQKSRLLPSFVNLNEPLRTASGSVTPPLNLYSKVDEICLHSLAFKNVNFYTKLNFTCQYFIPQYYYIQGQWLDGQCWTFDLRSNLEKDAHQHLVTSTSTSTSKESTNSNYPTLTSHDTKSILHVSDAGSTFRKKIRATNRGRNQKVASKFHANSGHQHHEQPNQSSNKSNRSISPPQSYCSSKASIASASSSIASINSKTSMSSSLIYSNSYSCSNQFLPKTNPKAFGEIFNKRYSSEVDSSGEEIHLSKNYQDIHSYKKHVYCQNEIIGSSYNNKNLNQSLTSFTTFNRSLIKHLPVAAIRGRDGQFSRVTVEDNSKYRRIYHLCMDLCEVRISFDCTMMFCYFDYCIALILTGPKKIIRKIW